MAWLWVLSVVAGLGGLGWVCLQMMDPAQWKGTPGPHGPVRVTRNRSKVMAVFAGVPAPHALEFELRREIWYDRWLKRHGLAFEHQAGHANFDRTFFVLADDAMLVDRLRGDPTLCNRLLQLCGPGVPGGFKFARVACAGGTLWAEYGWTKPFMEAEVDKLVGGLQLRLQAIAPDLPTALPGSVSPAIAMRRAALRLEQAALLVFLAGLAGLAMLWATGLPQIVDRGRLWIYSALVAALFLVAILDWARTHLGRSSRAHRLFAIWLFIGAPGLVVCAMLWVRQVDITLDRHAGYLRMGGVTGVHTYSGRRLPRRYAADVFLLPPDADPHGRVDRVHLQLDVEDFGRLPLIGGVQVVEHPGLLGLRWIERVDDGDEWRERFGLKGRGERP